MSKNIIDYLYQHALSKPDDVAFRFLSDTQVADEITFKQMWLNSYAIAEFLKENVSTGDCVLLLYPSGLAYIKAFYACLIAGVIAVPLYPPRKNKTSKRIWNVAQSCSARIALTTLNDLSTIEGCWQQENTHSLELTFYPTDNVITENTDIIKCDDISFDSTAFLQYTSGSTGTPKGVIISHECIMANVKHLSTTSGANEDDVFVNWLPLFHDLGLVTAILLPVCLGTCSVLMAPATFIINPLSWFKAISLYRGSVCGAPNFAYDLCINKISDDELSSLDLSCWRIAYNAAEPVKAETLEKFIDKFFVCGFKQSSLYPSYGMAEATAFISGGQASEHPKIIYVDKKKLAKFQLKLMDKDNALSSSLVGCGAANTPHAIKVVNPKSQTELKEGDIGEIWFAGPSVSTGYWQLGDISKETFGKHVIGDPSSAHEYLRTGDYGVIWQGELYVTGRIKDLIILNGVNYYPQDIEESAVKAHDAVRATYNAAFSLTEEGIEKLVVVTELERKFFRTIDHQIVINSIRQQIFDDHQVSVDRVILLKPYMIPTTSSGKIQRNQTKLLLSSGELDVLAYSNQLPKKVMVNPETQIEDVIHSIWCTVLKQASISTIDNFFDIGGDSISAIQISAEIDKTYQHLTFYMDQLLELATIKDIAQYIELTRLHRVQNLASISSNLSGRLKI
jgi:acyl-CoA synthetase (AMP-forming)/AMP-acid ligase II/acyl carrier protein